MQNKKLSSNFKNLVKILADGHYHTGTMLGKQLNISRNAVWKHVQQLLHYGFLVETQHQGYALKQKLILLDAAEITDNIHYQGTTNIAPIIVLGDVGSTNDYLQQELKTNPAHLQFCLAERQLAGRGRFGRTWHSPFGTNIYLSCRWQCAEGMNKLGGLSLVVGLAVLKAMQRFGVRGIALKWPNDILWQQEKLSGVLVEVKAESHGQAEIIIGVGVNANMADKETTEIQRAWTTLEKISGVYCNRNVLAGFLITSITDTLDTFVEQGFQGFQAAWAEHDYLFGKEITLHNGSTKIKGRALGVNAEGCLLLALKDEATQAYSAGEVSLSPV